MRDGNWKQCLAVYGYIGCIAVAAAAFVLLPKTSVSKSERRRLAQMPALTAQSLSDESYMEDFETYLLDHFPFRDGLRRIKAYFAYYVLGQKENNGIYVVQEHAAKLEYPLNEDSVVRFAEKMQTLKAQYFSEENTWYGIVPDKNYFLAQANGYPSIDYGNMLACLQKKLDADPQKGEFQYIDIMSGLSIADYYHTDTHWRQEHLFQTAEKIGKALGVEKYLRLDRAVYDSKEIKDFYGVYYGQAALPMQPDTIVCLADKVTDAARVWNIEENMTKGSVWMPYDENAVFGPVYRMDKLERERSFDKYDVFLGGAASLQIITSPAAATDKRLILFRDSYTSSLVPLLLAAYSEITLIDLRYISTDLVGKYVDFTDADILFLYNTSIVNSSGILK